MGLKIFNDTYKLMLDRRVPLTSKIIFAVVAIGYTISPDLMPFLPFDDLIVVWLASRAFVKIASKQAGYGKRRTLRKKDKNTIDIDGEIIE